MMSLTTAQQATFRTDVLADGALNVLPHNSDSAFFIASVYNVAATPTFTVWCSTVSTDDIFNQVTWANLTPIDVPDGTQQWLNRAMACQGKQFNLQTMLAGRGSLQTGKTTIRAGLQDALTNVPSGAGGALLSAGWVAVRDGPLKRNATRAEKLLASGNGVFATPADLGFEGSLNSSDVMSAMGW